MTSRGVDQVLPHPGDPRLYEDYVPSALGYVRLAERASGPLPRPADFPYVWGDALDVKAKRCSEISILKTILRRRGYRTVETNPRSRGPRIPG
jgi:poly-gamma-glutamate capsule biosynthesis protein CapA/YwtB (metallophosphatase superfamily)